MKLKDFCRNFNSKTDSKVLETSTLWTVLDKPSEEAGKLLFPSAGAVHQRHLAPNCHVFHEIWNDRMNRLRFGHTFELAFTGWASILNQWISVGVFFKESSWLKKGKTMKVPKKCQEWSESWNPEIRPMWGDRVVCSVHMSGLLEIFESCYLFFEALQGRDWRAQIHLTAQKNILKKPFGSFGSFGSQKTHRKDMPPWFFS